MNKFFRQVTKRLVYAGLALMAATMNLAVAGEFNEIDGVAIRGYDPVAYIAEQKAIAGKVEFTGVYKGSSFRFKDSANREAFLANPEKYAPQFGGYCAFGVSRGYKADTAPDAFSIVDGKLFLNYNGEVKAMWTKDRDALVGKAEANWPTVAKTTKVIR